MMGFIFSWDRFLGAILGFMLAWVLYSVLNQTIWLPAEREAGREEVRTETLKRAVELVQERSRTNANVRKLDNRSLCIELGGLYEDGVCR
jgi:hypothetical protein